MTRAIEWLVAGVTVVLVLAAGWIAVSALQLNSTRRRESAAPGHAPATERAIFEHEQAELDRVVAESEALRAEADQVAAAETDDDRSAALAAMLNRRRRAAAP